MREAQRGHPLQEDFELGPLGHQLPARVLQVLDEHWLAPGFHQALKTRDESKANTGC